MNSVSYITLSHRPIDVESALRLVRSTEAGAVATFEGRVRSPNNGEITLRLEYEAYADVAERQMNSIAEEVAAHCGAAGIVCVHRTGAVVPGELALLVAASSPHRRAALDAVDLMVERVKAEVAIWKLEVSESGSWWAGLPGELSSPAPAGT